MPRYYNNKRRSNRADNNSSSSVVMRQSFKTLHDDLKELSAIQRTQERSLPPQIRDVPKLIQPKERVMTLSRSYFGANITGNTSAATSGAFYFTLDALPAFNELTTLYDAYRILQATVTFYPTVMMPAVSGSPVPSLLTVLDYDDSSTTVDAATLLQYPSYMQSAVGSLVERTLNPYAANAAYSGAFTSYTRMPRNTWVDTNSPGVRYYGLKWYIDTLPASTQTTLWTSTVRLIFQVKNVR